MNEVKKFDHELFGQLSVIIYEDKPHFIGSYVAKTLGYAKPNNAINTHCKNAIKLSRKELLELGIVTKSPHGLKLINESDVVNLVSYNRNGACESIKQYILDQMPNGNYVATSSRDEHVALDTIEQLLGIKLIRQFRVGEYIIDGYHKETKTAYEIDDYYHSRQTDIDAARQKDIENILGCTFIRINV